MSHKKDARLIRVNNVKIISNCLLQDMMSQIIASNQKSCYIKQTCAIELEIFSWGEGGEACHLLDVEQSRSRSASTLLSYSAIPL